MGGASGRIGELVARLARRHEERLRGSFADALERAVAEVDGPLHRGGAAVAIDRPAVAEAAPLLLAIAGRLRAGPIPPAAIGLIRSLVSDGAGPLYARSAHRSEYPPGTLSLLGRAVLAACEDRVPAPTPAPRERVRI
jgi:hypothetical protein